MNDPMGIFQTKNGSWHIGYECQPNRYEYGNISQCSASTTDFTYFNDYRSWKDPTTLAPSQLYDIRGIFDGNVIKEGYKGLPTLLYSSAYTSAIGWNTSPPEIEGAETQSMAYTEDDGETWIKLPFEEKGNPVIYSWPEKNLTNFRDPFFFESEDFLTFYSNSSIHHKIPSRLADEVNQGDKEPQGSKFLIISSGIRGDSDSSGVPAGPRLFLYRQTEEDNVLDWTYLGTLIELPQNLVQPSPWRGAWGVNFELSSLFRLDERGRHIQDTNSIHQLDILLAGSEGARDGSHEDHWPLWWAINYDYSRPDGDLKAKIEFGGVIDWGRAYAFSAFTGADNRQIVVGFTYETGVLAAQKGSLGAFTLFRDVFVKVIRNVLPGTPELNEPNPSWAVKTEQDGSKSIVTYGQKIVQETLTAYKKESTISKPDGRTLDVGAVTDSQTVPTNVVGFEIQPSDKYYAITAQLDFHGSRENSMDRSSMVRGGFRVLASDKEWTDIYYDPSEEALVVSRLKSSLISDYENFSDRGKLRLWPIRDPVTNTTSMESLNLTIIVDNRVLEVYANDQTVITTQVYPWLMNSTAVSFFVQAPEGWNTTSQHLMNTKDYQTPNKTSTFHPHHSVTFSNVELWDGLLNAWPNRPRDSSLAGSFGHQKNISIYGLWSGV
ncbi:hypothetical protein CROQUDRAFT_80665 [Cronartium quercuum f. sp. fusiforme G11]|uniref:Uncharacterized protein n=1 Tax=Cronartium quercuum f. sp. fusiforme G11 TaxID=708437 RepID=A0A9P6NH06_9BASI|nr:hypothetical protein CROQUDRAFT_80665 [Cronartium quercuum f. sp. fusiforme G11]